MTYRSILLGAGLLSVAALPMAAQAQPVSGLYIGAGAGANFMHDESLNRTTFPAFPGFNSSLNNSKPNLQLDTGFVGVGSIGYGLGNGLRIELEGSYRQNKLNKLTTGAGTGTVGATNAGGDEMKFGAMVNVLYDIPISFVVQPYVGIGGGYQWSQFKNVRAYGTAVPSPGFPNGSSFLFRTNDGDGSFAAQFIGGAAFPIAAVPGLALTAEYRFLALVEDRSYNFQYFAPGVSTRARLRFEDNFNHSVMLGVRYAFNAAPAVVAAPITPVAPQTDSRTYLVFFDWDRADLTDRARAIIAQAAQATTRVQVTRIEVSGHTDTSGTARYNQGLSVRRANNVKAELVRLGVPAASITTAGYGFSRPLVATGPGVREPQNRRVEIVLR